MTQRVPPEAGTFELGGREWPVIIDGGVMIEAEALTGVNYFYPAAWWPMSVTSLWGLLVGMIHREDPDVEAAQVKRWITVGNLPDLRDVIRDRYHAEMTEGREGPSGPGPRPEAPVPAGETSGASSELKPESALTSSSD